MATKPPLRGRQHDPNADIPTHVGAPVGLENDNPFAAAPDEDTDRHAVAPRRAARPGKAPTGEHRAPKLPPAPSTSRLATQLGRVFKRKREAIGLDILQAASLSGIAPTDISSYEAGSKTPFDHALVLARILGIPPTDLPGIRTGGDSPLRGAILSARQGLAEAVRLIYRCSGEEKLEGPVDALTGVSEFAVETGDNSLPDFPCGTVLGFLRDRAAPVPESGVVLAHHRPSRVLALRRLQGELLVALHPDLPSYHHDKTTWEVVGRMVLVIHPVGA